MNEPHARLRAIVRPKSTKVIFELLFAAPTGLSGSSCAQGFLETGDGERLALGVLCEPTRDMWSTGHTLVLGEHVYARPRSYVATLHWGPYQFEAEVNFAVEAVGSVQKRPLVTHFSALAADDKPLEVIVTCAVADLKSGQSVRIDGGAGNIRWWGYESTKLNREPGTMRWYFGYPKPGSYVVRADLLDVDGYWVARLVETPIEIAAPAGDDNGTGASGDSSPPATEEAKLSVAASDSALDSAANVPWLPFRYVRPAWAWARTYTRPGGGVISRVLGLGTYLAIRQEVASGGDIWYQTGSYDWIPASAVVAIAPSQLRGVELSVAAPEPGPEPEPEPEPEPDLALRGTVIAKVLNVRSGPGVHYPIVDQVQLGTQVTIDAKAEVAGAIWYRIGTERWVHGSWLQLEESEPEPKPQPTRQGVVTASALSVRARPGGGPGNPPIDRLLRGEQVTIYAEAEVDGGLWYRIGTDRWVHSAWVRVVSSAMEQEMIAGPSIDHGSLLSTTEPALPAGWVVAASLHIRSTPGSGAESEIVGLLAHNQSVAIVGESVVAGQKWYQIGTDQWVLGASIGVARQRARPSSIGASEQWVGVNLREQTAVAYEGDNPVYAALVATGLPATPTVRGIFRTWIRFTSRKMSGGSPATGGYYYLEEVPWTCYFYSGYALHAAYWHDAFGRPRSHGCVNLSPYDAWWIFQWSAAGGRNSPAVYVYWE